MFYLLAVFSSYYFTNLMKHVLTLLRSRGYLSVNCLDDFLNLSDLKDDCIKNVTKTEFLLESLGFILGFRSR